LAKYYQHQLDLMKGYERDPAKVKENTRIITAWIMDAEGAARLLRL
jgi:hypothetical protein